MAQVLSEVLFPGRDNLLTLDMTEFGGQHAGEHARWRLVGAPAPYVGWERGGLLTSHAREHPISVVLVDEFDKAPPEARNVLLRVFDEGWAQDGSGRTVSFREMYFILTANAGRSLWDNVKKIPEIGYTAERGAETQPQATAFSEEKIRDVLRTDPGDRFAPELLSRLSHIVMFKELEKVELAEIARRKMARLRESALLEDIVWLEYDEHTLPLWLVNQCGERADCRRMTALFEHRIEVPLARFRAQRGNEPTILKLEPLEKEVRLTPAAPEDAAARLPEVLFKRVAEVFAQQGRRRQQAQAVRTQAGTVA
jgi:type VI secretion system protein VasG